MKKSLPTLIMVLTIILSSFLMVNNANYTLSSTYFSNELLLKSNTNKIDDLQEYTPEIIETPYEPYINPEAARTGPQDFCTILVYFPITQFPVGPRLSMKASCKLLMITGSMLLMVKCLLTGKLKDGMILAAI